MIEKKTRRAFFPWLGKAVVGAALAAYGIGFVPENIKQIKKLVIDLKNNPQKLKGLKENIAAIAKPFACQEIARVIR